MINSSAELVRAEGFSARLGSAHDLFHFSSKSKIGRKRAFSPLWSCKSFWFFFTLFEIIQEDEETERVRYNALLDEEDEANEAAKFKDPEKDGNDSAYASKVGNYTTVF